MFPLFTNVALLAGLAAIAAPIIIHLLLRRKNVRQRFSTIQFFLRQNEQAMQKRKLRNLILLTARVLLFALIILGFSRPYLPDRGALADPAESQQVILLLDTSISMQATGSRGAQWTRALEMARQALSTCKPADRVALLPFPLQDNLTVDYVPPAIALQRLGHMKPSWGLGDLTAGLQQVNKLLAISRPAGKTTLVIVSDLQQSGCQNLAAVPLPQEINIQIMDLGERFIPNTAVTELKMDVQTPSDSQAMITSFSDEKVASLPIQLKIDGRLVLEQSLSLPAGGVTNLPLSLPALPPGWHEAEFSIEISDGLAVDNSRFTSFFVPEPIHCLVVETRKSQRTFQEESFFVATALNPNKGSNAASPSRFIYHKIDVESLASQLSSRQPRIEFVILPGLKQISRETAQALHSYVETGGGLLLFLGEGVSANSYHTELHKLLPVRLGHCEILGEEDAPWRIAVYNKTSPCFLPFQSPGSGSLYLPEFTRRFALTPVEGSIVSAEFDDEVPLLAHHSVGRGRVVLVNTTADTLWTDWPKHKTFLPWLHATAFFLSGRAPSLQTMEVPAIVSGGAVDLDLGTPQTNVTCQDQNGQVTRLTSDAQGHLNDIPLEAPGLYVIKHESGLELRRLAVNPPVTESELAALSPAEFQSGLSISQEPIRQASAGLLGDSARGKELWRLLLMTALLLMLVEPLVANRTFA